MNWNDVIHILVGNARNYFVIAGIAFIIFYVLLKKKIFFTYALCALMICGSGSQAG